MPRPSSLWKKRKSRIKVELINDLPEDAVISFYKQGEFTDLCAGPHLDSTGRIKGNGIKLTACNAAYWRGDSNREMLQRIYGVAFPKKEELDAYLAQVEEAKKRDHNKLGRELEYFTTVDCIGQGLPVLLPKGARVVQVLQRWVEDVEQKRGYLLTKTPLMAKRDLYKISGHWDHYLDGMFILGDPYDETKECFALRPMTCPFQYQVYLNRQRSYRDLPMRLGETSTLFRNEDSGEMHGLIRVRQFTISEGHLDPAPRPARRGVQGLPRPCQVLPRHRRSARQVHVPLLPVGSREPEQQVRGHDGAVGSRPERDGAASSTISTSTTPSASTRPHSTARSSISSIRTSTARRTPSSPSRSTCCWPSSFGMYYIDENGEKKLPYIIHRTSLGCYERTLAYLIEEYAGALPTWMAPEQVRFLPVTDRAADYCAEQAKKLEDMGFRVEVDYRNEKIGQQDPRRADGEGPLHGGRRRPRHGERHRFPAPPRGRRPRRDEHGRVLRAAQAGRGQQGKEIIAYRFCIISI